jgi:hypothetical protein
VLATPAIRTQTEDAQFTLPFAAELIRPRTRTRTHA